MLFLEDGKSVPTIPSIPLIARKPFVHRRFRTGYSYLQLYPKCTLLYPHVKTYRLLLGVRARSFAYTQKVARILRSPCAKAFPTLSSYFVLPVCLLRECAVFDVNVTFASNIFKVRLLVKVTLLIEMTLSITTVKQVVLVMKEWYFTVKNNRFLITY